MRIGTPPHQAPNLPADRGYITSTPKSAHFS